MKPIKKDSWQFKLLMFVAMKVVKAPFYINYTHPDMEYVEGMGFAWSSEMASLMTAKYTTPPPVASRSVRRAIKRAAKESAKDLYNGNPQE